MPKKTKKAEEVDEEVSSDEEVEAPVNVDDDDDEEEEEAKKEKDKATLRNLRKKARNSGYRKLAVEVGAGTGENVDMLKYALTRTDVERLAKWCNETGEGVNDLESLRERLEMKFSSLPEGALAILHAHVEGFARNVMGDVASRVFEGASATVTAAHMRNALRKLTKVLDFEYELPAGVVEHARTAEKGVFALDEDGSRMWNPTGTVLPALTEEEQVKLEEKKVGVKALNKVIKGKERAHALKKEEAKKARAHKVEERRAAEQPVSAAI